MQYPSAPRLIGEQAARAKTIGLKSGAKIMPKRLITAISKASDSGIARPSDTESFVEKARYNDWTGDWSSFGTKL